MERSAMQPTAVSKSNFKARALEYFRMVEKTGRELIVTDHGRPVIRIVPYRDAPPEVLLELRDSVVRYDAPTEPVGEDDWESAE
jgi:prevent-host-death family protein